jgi:phosphoserine phosphatase
LLRGLPSEHLESTYNERVKLTSGAMTLIQTCKKLGITSLLVSGGFTFFTQKISDLIGFDVNRANILEIKDGKLTGEVLSPIVDSSTKINSLNEYVEKLSLSPHQTIAVGDGANDIPMIKGAGLGVAYHAKAAAAKAADAALHHSDLTALLYLMGIKEEDFC